MSSKVYAGSLRIPPDQVPNPELDIMPEDDALPVAVLAGGCFWCVEAVYRPIEGVLEIMPGYAGGDPTRANYRDVCSDTTGHAETVQIRYDPTKISYGQILKYFFAIAHDPTQENRQGNDVGSQYRSAIFYINEEQAEVARNYIDQLTKSGVFVAPIVTQVVPLDEFYPGENYHQDYAANNPEQPYITHVAMPKVDKLRHYFADRLKS